MHLPTNASCLTLFCSATRKFKTQQSSTVRKVFSVVPGFDFALAGSQHCPGFDGGIRTCRNDVCLSVHYKVWELEADEAKDANFAHFPLSCCVPAVFCFGFVALVAPVVVVVKVRGSRLMPIHRRVRMQSGWEISEGDTLSPIATCP